MEHPETSRNRPKLPIFFKKPTEITLYFLKLNRNQPKNIPKTTISFVLPDRPKLVPKFKRAPISVKIGTCNN